MKNILLAAVGLMAVATPAFAQEETKPFTVSGSVALVTDYRLRGVSQSDEKAAIQAGVTVSHTSGLYAGVWGSNLAGWGTFGGANMELDLIAGYKFPITDAVALDVGATWYMYPGGYDNTDFIEAFAKFSGTIGPASATVGVAYAPEQEAIGPAYIGGADYVANFPVETQPGAKDDNLYIWGDLAAGIPSTPVTLKGHLGFSQGNRGLGPFGTSPSPTGAYMDWMVGADLSLGPVVLGVAYVDTDIDNAERQYLLPNFGSTVDGSQIASGRVVGSITAAF